MKARIKKTNENVEVVRYCSTIRGDLFECLSTGKRYFHDEIELEEEEAKFGTASNSIEIKSNANCLTQERVDELATKIDKELPSGNQNEWELPDGYQFTDENGNVINATKIVLEKKKKEYPKTIEECKDKTVAGSGYKTASLLIQLERLLICRDAYWKIAGEEMGLGKPWEPDWLDDDTKKYVITSTKVFETFGGLGYINYILTFPTEEMRDAFYENFKELINKCKELL